MKCKPYCPLYVYGWNIRSSYTGDRMLLSDAIRIYMNEYSYSDSDRKCLYSYRWQWQKMSIQVTWWCHLIRFVYMIEFSDRVLIMMWWCVWYDVYREDTYNYTVDVWIYCLVCVLHDFPHWAVISLSHWAVSSHPHSVVVCRFLEFRTQTDWLICFKLPHPHPLHTHCA